MQEKLIAILLATYNGATFLPEQIESIRSQTIRHFKLYIRDDGSSDDSLKIAQSYARKDARIQVLEDDFGRLGPAQNFGLLMKKAKKEQADYIFFSDQDDVWLPRKVEKELALLKQHEKTHGEIPLLVHTDLAIVDSNLQLIHKSFLKFSRLSHKDENALRILLVQNFVTGATVAINRALLEFALPVPACCPIHDWWLALCAAACGRILFLPEPTVLYRQHEGNVIGAMRLRDLLLDPQGSLRKRIKHLLVNLMAGFFQSGELLTRIKRRGMGATPQAVLLRGFLNRASNLPFWVGFRFFLNAPPRILPRLFLLHLALRRKGSLS